MKSIVLISGGMLSALVARGLTPGDVAIVGWIDNGAPDSFAIVTLAPVAAGAVIYFTDNGWTGTQFRGASATDGDGSETLMKFTTVHDIAAGLIIRTSDVSSDYSWTTSGSVPGTTAGSFGMLSLAAAGDQIYAFTGPLNNPLNSPEQQVFALDNTGTFEPATSSSTGDVPPGLTLGVTALSFAQTANPTMAFNPATLSAGTKAEWLAAIADSSHWTFGNSGVLPAGTVVVVPEPGPSALLGVGFLGLAMWNWRSGAQSSSNRGRGAFTNVVARR